MSFKSYFIYSIGGLSIVLLILGISLAGSQVFQNILYSRIKEQVVLKNGSQSFDVWKNPPSPVYMQFYFFNLTNPVEVLKGERPAVFEIGPYTYREFRPMEQVVFLENGTKVSAVNPKTYFFVPEMSKGSEEDLIRTVNIPVMTVMKRFKDNPVVSNLISAYLKSTGEGLFTTRAAGELLWGYEDDLLRTLHTLDPDVDVTFGLFYKMNGTNNGEYVFFTGQQNYEDFARIAEWRDSSSLSWWTTADCNMINGTDGASFHPLVDKDERLDIFSSDLCRSIYAVYERESKVTGIPTYRFVPPAEVFANETVNPANAGFCVPAGNCLDSGLLNVSTCKQDAPIIMSSPHFYQADEKYINAVFGMKPRKELHETFVEINPLTGLVLQAAKRLQVNVFIEKIPSFSQTGDVRTLVFPVVHLNESVLIDQESAAKLRSVVSSSTVLLYIPYLLIGLGILLGSAFVGLALRQRVPESTPAERQPILPPS